MAIFKVEIKDDELEKLMEGHAPEEAATLISDAISNLFFEAIKEAIAKNLGFNKWIEDLS